MKIFILPIPSFVLFFAAGFVSTPALADEKLPVSEASRLEALASPLAFAVDGRLRKNVDFWISIYSQYDTSEGVVHDAKYIDKVYEVVSAKRPGAVRASKNRWAGVLISVHHKSKARAQGKVVLFTPDEQKAFDMYLDVNEPDKYLAAAHRKRLRFQLGQKDRFIEGIRMSGQYLPLMEEIFRKEKLPLELTRLPFVESTFNLKARSKVGASGIWQFMRSTGKLFLRIDDAVDERNDPVLATEAAAKLLKLNYGSLNSWGVAVTAYNHGRKGMMRAVRKVGSDQIEDLVGNYRSRSFGFASSNFFTCLLAAIEVERNSDKYFGKIERMPPLRFYEVAIPDFISLRNLTQFLKLDPKVVRTFNPGLSDEVFQGRLFLPRGYRLRLPRQEKDGVLEEDGEARIFLAGYSQIPGIYKHQRQKFSRND